MMQPMHLDRDSALTAAEPLPVPALVDPELDRPTPTSGRRLTRDSILFGAGTLAGKAIGFLVLPVFARLLVPDQFGRLDVLNTLVSSGILIAMLGTDVAAVRLFFDGRTSDDRRGTLATWGLIAATVAAIPSLALVAFAEPISRLLFQSTALALAVALVGVALFAGIVHFFTLGVLRATARPIQYAVLEGGALVVNAALAVVLLVLWRADATAVMLALAISWSGAATIGLALVRRSIQGRPSRPIARAILRLAIPLAPAIAAIWGADFFHRAYLLGAAGATEVAYLSVATRIGSVAMLVVAAAQLAWHPHAYRLGVTAASMERFAQEGRQIITALVISVGCLGLLTPEVLELIGGSAYAPSAPTVGLFLVSVLAVGLFTVGSLPSAIGRRTGDLGMAIIIGVAIAIIANVLVAGSFGSPGTAAAMALGQFVTATIAIRLGARRHAVPFEWPRMFGLVTMAAAVVIGATTLPDASGAVRVLLAVGFAIGLWLEGTLPAWLTSLRHREITGKA
jgi:O-antigen/teichoic acid export membrane protein